MVLDDKPSKVAGGLKESIGTLKEKVGGVFSDKAEEAGKEQRAEGQLEKAAADAQQRLEGTKEEVVGKARKKLGGTLANTEETLKGKAEQAKGEVKKRTTTV